MRRVAPFVAGLVFLAARGAVAQVPSGPEFQVSTAASNQRPIPETSMARDGSFTTVWQEGTGLPRIVGRSFDVLGNPVGSEFIVDGSPFFHRNPRVSQPDGHFVVTWESPRADGDGGVLAKAFLAGGTPIGPDLAVNTYVPGPQVEPAVASNGPAFVVVWTSVLDQDGSMEGVFGQLYRLPGAPVGSEFQVNTHTTFAQKRPAVALVRSPDRFVVVWESHEQEGPGSGPGIYGQRFDEVGAPVGSEFQVNTWTTGGQTWPDVAADAGGNFVVVWMGIDAAQTSYEIFGQRFDAAGAPRGGEFRVNTTTTGFQSAPSVSIEPNGQFVVTWQGQDTDAGGIFGQRYDSDGAPRGGEFRVNATTTSNQSYPSVGFSEGNFIVTWESFHLAGPHVFAQRFGGLFTGPSEVDGPGNRVFETGESALAAPSWRNQNGAAQTFTGQASNLTGPVVAPGDPTYTILDASADYATVPNGALGSCTATGNCYTFRISVPSARPAPHWDATYREDVAPAVLGLSPVRTLHIGDSFGDVPRTSGFYRFVETILHHNLTGGCGGGNFCPLAATPREQMAVFVLVAKEGAGYQPPACAAGSEIFADVPASNPFCRWIEELARRSIIGGCGGGNFCPLAPVSREQMALFALATKETPGYSPPACVAGYEMFADVPASNGFCRWIEELARRGVVGGCGGGNFCPVTAVSREQNSVFLTGTFALALY